MAELTQIESKLSEVIGLAQAAQDATSKVAKLVEDTDVKQTLERMGEEAKETEERGMEVAGRLDGKKTAIQEKARETKSEAKEMMDTYLGDDADGLDGLEFLIMAEAGELGHVEIVNKMSEQGGNEEIGEVAEWALGVQRRHFEQVRECALTLAAAEDPNEPEG
jgi:hypothetical protein